MTDLEFIDLYIEKSRDFIPPQLFREIQDRGLYNIINYLPYSVDEAKSIARARMAKMQRFFGEPEIDKISGEVIRFEFLLKRLNQTNPADAHDIIPILEEMLNLSKYIKDYFKPVIISDGHGSDESDGTDETDIYGFQI